MATAKFDLDGTRQAGLSEWPSDSGPDNTDPFQKFQHKFTKISTMGQFLAAWKVFQTSLSAVQKYKRPKTWTEQSELLSN